MAVHDNLAVVVEAHAEVGAGADGPAEASALPRAPAVESDQLEADADDAADISTPATTAISRSRAFEVMSAASAPWVSWSRRRWPATWSQSLARRSPRPRSATASRSSGPRMQPAI